MSGVQMTIEFVGRPSARVILDRIRNKSRDESEKGRWFEQLFKFSKSRINMNPFLIVNFIDQLWQIEFGFMLRTNKLFAFELLIPYERQSRNLDRLRDAV